MNPLSDAITQFENSDTAYNSTVSTTGTDQAQVDQIQTKLDNAKAQLATDQAAQRAAALARNSAIDALIAAATAAKIDVPADPAAPATPAAA